MKRTYGVPTKRELSGPRQKLLKLMSELGFGRIEGLHVRRSEPSFDPVPTMICVVKLGARNDPHPASRNADFALKDRVVELFEEFDRRHDFVISRLEVAHGLPLLLHVEEPVR